MAYGITVVLSVATTVLLLFIALGYRFNTKTGVIQSGLLLVDNKPEAGKVLINGEVKDTQAPSRFVLPVGTYTIGIQRSDYHTWSKDIRLEAEAVEDISYPLLIPKTLQAQPKLAISAPATAMQSGDGKRLVYHASGESVLHLIKLTKDNPTAQDIPLSAAFIREAGSVGTLRFIEWSLDNKFVLIEQQVSNSTYYVSLPVDKPEEAKNITKQFGDIAPSNPHYVGKNTDIVYGLHQGTLRQYDIKASEATEISARVRSYEPYGNNTIVYTRASEDSLSIEVVLQTKDTKTVLESSNNVSLQPIVTYGEYDDHTYAVIADSSASTVRIYRDALKKPILKQQIPYVTLSLSGAQYAKFSPNNQYVYVQAGQTFVSYDFENTRKHSFNLRQVIADRHPIWVNDSHLIVQSNTNQNYLLEFDGQNVTTLTSTYPGTHLYFGSDPRNAYRLAQSGDGHTLDYVSLVTE